MVGKHAVGQAVGDQVHRASVNGFKHVFGYLLLPVIMQAAVQAADRFHIGRNRVHVMGDQENGNRVIQSRQELIDCSGHLRIDTGGGFVQQQDLRIGGQGAGNIHPLALPDGEVADGALAQVSHFHLLERIADGLAVGVINRLQGAAASQ